MFWLFLELILDFLIFAPFRRFFLVFLAIKVKVNSKQSQRNPKQRLGIC